MLHAEIKLGLIEKILQESKLARLQAVDELLTGFRKEQEDHSRIVGYHPNGSRVSKKDLIQRIASALEDLDNGHLITTDQLENESEKW
jgi:hypothetical protein